MSSFDKQKKFLQYLQKNSENSILFICCIQKIAFLINLFILYMIFTKIAIVFWKKCNKNLNYYNMIYKISSNYLNIFVLFLFIYMICHFFESISVKIGWYSSFLPILTLSNNVIQSTSICFCSTTTDFCICIKEP